MSLATSILGKMALGQGLEAVFFKLRTSGTYKAQANGGDIVNFATAVADPTFQGAEADIQNAGSPPVSVDIFSDSGKMIPYSFALGTTRANGSLVIGAAAAYNTELANAGAYPEATMSGIAIFQRWI